jgi:hypothetical protein
LAAPAQAATLLLMLELTVHPLACPPGKIPLPTDAEARIRALGWFDCEVRLWLLLDRHYGCAGWSTAAAAAGAPTPVGLQALGGAAGDSVENQHAVRLRAGLGDSAV